MYFLFGAVNWCDTDIVTDIGFNSSVIEGVLRQQYKEGFETSTEIINFLEHYASIIEAEDFSWIMGIHSKTGNTTERFRINAKYTVTAV